MIYISAAGPFGDVSAFLDQISEHSEAGLTSNTEEREAMHRNGPVDTIIDCGPGMGGGMFGISSHLFKQAQVCTPHPP